MKLRKPLKEETNGKSHIWVVDEEKESTSTLDTF